MYSQGLSTASEPQMTATSRVWTLFDSFDYMSDTTVLENIA